MKIKVLLILFLFTSLLSFGQKSKKVFTAKVIKDLPQGSLPFYDTDESFVDVLVSFKKDIDTSKHKLVYGMQEKSNLPNKPDIYFGLLSSFPYPQAQVRIPINDTFLRSGNYSINFRLYNIDEQLISEEKVVFQTLRKKNNFFKTQELAQDSLYDNPLNIDISKTFVAKYDFERLRKNILALNPICNKTQAGAMQQLMRDQNIEYLQRFFFNFWKEKNPLHPEEEWKAYAEKLNYVAKKYGSGAYPGYKTDRGRVYLQYGPPNRSINASNERGTRPYEVWFYSNISNYTNVSILFVQVSARANDRVILHASNPNFYNNPNWQQQLFTDPDEIGNMVGHKLYDFFKQ